jgi:hypothetical protein
MTPMETAREAAHGARNAAKMASRHRFTHRQDVRFLWLAAVLGDGRCA